MAPPGWPAFNPNVVAELRVAGSAPDAPCPFSEHRHRIPWATGGYAKGTEFHGNPAVSFRVSPTYVLEDHLENFIVGRDLVEKLSGKAETWRLGNENSEDALSFNVFRSLKEADLLEDAARLLTGMDVTGQPQLIVWGNRLDGATVRPVPELKGVLDALEGTAGQQTEPDVILRFPGWGWIFVEAKLASPTSTYKGRAHKLGTWTDRYANPAVFDIASIAAAQPEEFPEQLLRNVAVARKVAGDEHVAVVALVREVYASKVTDWAAGYVADESIVTRTVTWEQLYSLTNDHEQAADLRRYMAEKSVNLRQAFKL